MRKLNMKLTDLYEISHQCLIFKPDALYNNISVSKIIDSYSHVFELKVGCIPDYTCP